MPEAKIAQAVELLDLMLEHFVDDGHWTRGRYDEETAASAWSALFASEPVTIEISINAAEQPAIVAA